MEELPDEVHAKIQELCARGDELAQSSQLAEALKSYWAAWDLLPEPKTNWEAATWDSIGYIRNRLGDHRQAITCYQRAIELYRERADRYNEADSLCSLGDLWQSIGESDAACRAWGQALAIFDEIGHPDREGVSARLADARRQASNGSWQRALSSRAG